MSISPPPIPVEPLSYAIEYVDARRPGSLIGIGVISIAMSMLFGLSALVAVMLALRAASGPTARNSTMVTALTSAYAEGIGPYPRGLVLNQISKIRTLSPTRRDVLEGFLAQQGERIDRRLQFGTLSDPQLVDKLVTQMGTTDEGFDYILFTSGRLTLQDTKAVFQPWDSTEVLAVDFSTADPKPGMLRFDPAAGREPSGSATVKTTARVIISNTSITLQAIAGTLSGALAVLLMVAGISTLRARPAGRTMHLCWAWLKIVASLFGAVASYVFYRELSSQDNLGNGQASSGASPVLTGLTISLIGFGAAILYPIAVLIVMHLRSVKNYLSSVG